MRRKVVSSPSWERIRSLTVTVRTGTMQGSDSCKLVSFSGLPNRRDKVNRSEQKMNKNVSLNSGGVRHLLRFLKKIKVNKSEQIFGCLFRRGTSSLSTKKWTKVNRSEQIFGHLFRWGTSSSKIMESQWHILRHQITSFWNQQSILGAIRFWVASSETTGSPCDWHPGLPNRNWIRALRTCGEILKNI